MPPDTAARRISAFGQHLHSMALPANIREMAQLHLLDAIGVALAAASLNTRPRIESAIAILGTGQDATGLGLSSAVPAPSAALLNGSLVHALEFDDTHMGAVVHASAVVMPTALAIAEREQCTGENLLKAFTLGWELMARAGQASPGGFHARGFQGTAVLGAPVAAAVAAWLMRLDDERTVSAMGIAGSQASGIFEFISDGTTVKMLHGGWPAHAGIVAAALAQADLSGPATVFEGTRGVFRAYTDDADSGDRFFQALGTLGQHWLLPEVAFKPYPCCHYIQAALQALAMIQARGVTAADVAQLDCQLPREVAWLVCEPWSEKLAPPSGHVAKFSLPWCLASLLVDGQVDVSTFDRHEVDERLLPTMQRMHFQAMDQSAFPARFPARIQIRTHDGRLFDEEVPDVHGSPGYPFTRDDVLEKFRDNALRTLTTQATADVIAAVDELHRSADLAQLSHALRGVTVD